jgi:hypothetical protein
MTGSPSAPEAVFTRLGTSGRSAHRPIPIGAGNGRHKNPFLWAISLATSTCSRLIFQVM